MAESVPTKAKARLPPTRARATIAQSRTQSRSARALDARAGGFEARHIGRRLTHRAAHLAKRSEARAARTFSSDAHSKAQAHPIPYDDTL